MEQQYLQYTGCGLDNIYLSNGFTKIETPYGEKYAINDIDGLHKAIGSYLTRGKKDLSGDEIRFLRHELLMSQYSLAVILGVTEQTVHRWEAEKTEIPKSSERLLRLLYQESVLNKNESISFLLKQIALIEDKISEAPMYFSDSVEGWRAVG